MPISRRQFIDCTWKSVGGAVGFGTVGATLPCLWGKNFSAADETSPARHLTTLLFFDDWALDRRDHVELRMGHPQWHPESTFLDPGLNLAWAYPSVFLTTETGQWRLLYQGWDAEKGRLYPLVAESQDGIRWTIPDLSKRVSLPDRMRRNQVLPVSNFTEWRPCYYDERAAPAERLKGLVFQDSNGQRPKSHLWVSPNGIDWQLVAGTEWQRDTPDPVTCAFWDARRSKYVLTTRPSLNDRRIAVVETEDWRNFSEPVLALEADALDTPLAQLYGMPVFPYEGQFVGLLWIYHVSAEVQGQSPLKFRGGKVDSQLAFSRDGWHFQRCLRDAFMPNTDPGELGAGCLQPCSMVIADEKSIRIYACGARQEHGTLVAGDGGIALYTLRKDGFMYLEPPGGTGMIGTRPLLWAGGRLEINSLGPDGEVRVQVTDSSGVPLDGYGFADSLPFGGDDVHWEPRWKGNLTCKSIAERVLRFEMRLRNARLYAIRGNFQVLTAAEARRYEKEKQGK